MNKLNLTLGIRMIPWCLWLAICLTNDGALGQPSGEDHFLRGYATSVLEHQFQIRPNSLRVKEGVLSIPADELAGGDPDKIRETLMKIQGIDQVVFVELGEAIETDPPPVMAEAVQPAGGEFLPPGHLFRPLMADQRWPHFSSALHHYRQDQELENVGAVSLGATIPLYENDFWDDEGRWSIGIEGVVFSIFDLDADSKDLVNSDYWVGIPFSYSRDAFAAVARVYHQSSHLGDEFLLRNPITRVDLNYEAFDLRMSYQFFDETVRLYGGGGYIFSKNPSSLKPWSLQAGVEFRCPRVFWKFFRPVAAIDWQTREENDWDLDWSARAGLQLDAEKLDGRTLQILFEYFQGHSPNGQFFERDIEFFGLGVHFYL